MAFTAGEEVDFHVAFDDEFDAINISEVKTGEEAEAEAPIKYPAKLHARKVAKELRLNHGLVYLAGEPTRLYEDSDQGPTFRQRRYFFYVTGVDFADCHVTYEIESDRLIIFIPYVEPRKVLWYGRTPTAAQALQRYDADEVRYAGDMPAFFREYFSSSPSASSSSPFRLYSSSAYSRARLLALRAEHVPSFVRDHIDDIVVDTQSLRPAMDRARVIKTPYEIAQIRRANDVSSAAHREVARALRGLRNEQQVEAVFRAGCTARGAHAQAYPIIAGAGENASTLHYGANDQPLAGKELLVLDAGCEWSCYASDVTRTLPITGRFSPEGRAVHDLVARMQDECVAAVRPGGSFYLLHLHAARVAVEGLLALGLLRGDPADVEAKGIAAAFFPHGLGHHVGLEVHDVSGEGRLMGSSVVGRKREEVTPAGLVALRSMSHAEAKRALLRPGMIVTVEPGIYFCREYIEGYFLSRPEYAKHIDKDVLEGYYHVGGARIEDDILVTEDGYENLTKAPKGQELFDLINGE